MSYRIIEISENGRFLHVKRGFLVIEYQKKEIGRIPLDDIAALIGSAKQLTYSHNVLVSLSERNVPVVFCGKNMSPTALLWSVSGNYRQSKIMDAQLSASLPLKKKIWKQVVQEKIKQQSVALESVGVVNSDYEHYVKKVKSGDPENVEAEVASRYWKQLFGKHFVRDRDEEGTNALLNYGYTIMRATVARAVMGAGLHPSMGIHHQNQNNPMRLVDDLMEPFRPLVDVITWFVVQSGDCSLTKTIKAEYVSLLHMKLVGRTESSNCLLHIRKLATSLAQVYLGEQEGVVFPPTALPLQLTRSYSELKQKPI